MSSDFWHAEQAMNRSANLPRVLTEPFRRETWSRLLFALLGLPLGVAGFTFTVFALSFSAGMMITFVGLPLLALSGLMSRQFGDWVRRLANALLGTALPAAAPLRTRPGLLGWIGSCVTDGTGWRARLYLLLKLPLGILTFVTATVCYAYGFGGITYPVWRPFLPCQTSPDGTCHRGTNITDHYWIDTPFRIFLMALAGALLVLAGPWLVRAAVAVDVAAMRVLLGPTAGSVRVAELERTRAVAVDDSAATLRRIERDLHDGAQARLVALAMNVGLARTKLAEGSDPAEASRLLDSAHSDAKHAIAELRDLARGIHPPVLDAGLDAALETLAANSVLPVRLYTAVTERPEPAIETMMYFCAAELLTNAGKHSGAQHVDIDARTSGGRLGCASATTVAAAPASAPAPGCPAWPSASPPSTAR